MRLKRNSFILAVTVIICAVMSLFITPVSAVNVVSGDSKLDIGGRLQMLGVLESLQDPTKNDQRMVLFMKQSRLNIQGTLNGVDYYTELMFGGEEVPKSNTVMSLLDFYAGFHVFNCPVTGTPFSLRVGQFKIPYSREALTDDGILGNADRSIQDLGFRFNRDVGLALYTASGKISGAFGVFTGGGMNIPQRYLPQIIGIPLTVARIGYNNGMDKDVFTPYQADKSEEIKYAGYINAFYCKDSRVGHGAPLGTKYWDRSLLLNVNWNPYVSSLVSGAPAGFAGTVEQAQFWQAGADFAAEIPLADKVIQASAEINTGEYFNSKGGVRLTGGMVKGNMVMGKLEFGLRYAALLPDPDMAYTSGGTRYKLFNNSNIIHEVTPSIIVNLGKNLKLVMDAPVGIDTPVAIEAGNGAYNLMLQPDQSSYANPNAVAGAAWAGKSKIERQTVFTGRMMLQFQF